MIGQPFQLQGQGAQELRPRGHAAARQGLDRLAVCRRVPDRRVPGQRLRVVDGPRVRPADEGPLDAAVLVAQRDLEVVDLLAMALEPEVAGLDDPRVDRADRHLVDLLAVHAEEPRHARLDFRRRALGQYWLDVAERPVEAHRL